MSAISKKSSKRKIVADDDEEEAVQQQQQQPAVVPEDVDDEEEDAAAAAAAAAKKSKHKKSKHTKVADAPAAAAAAVAAAPAAESVKTKAEMIQEIMASMTDEEKSVNSGALVPFVAAPVAAAASAPAAAVAIVPKLALIGDGDDDADDAKAFVAKLQNAFKAIPLAMVRKGATLVKNPDLSVLLWSAANKHKLHFMELDAPERDLHVRRSKDMKYDEKLKKKVSSGGKEFINLNTKFDQAFTNDITLRGFNMLSPFFRPAFLNHGNTVDTGVNGTQGKVIRDNVTRPGGEQYQLSVTNKPYSILIQDSDYNNPIVSHFFDVWEHTVDTALAKAMADPENMTEIRKVAKLSHKNKMIDKMPDTDLEWVAWMKKSANFKTRFGADESDPSMKMLGMGVSCYRKPQKHYQNGKVWAEEDLSDYVPPSAMFEEQKFDEKGNVQIHNNLPVWRCRRADEVEPGVHYDSPFILIPQENVHLTSQDVIAVIFQFGLYEWQFDVAGATAKQQGYIWLNKADELKKLALDDITACDPRYCVPGAGRYVGPLDKIAAGASGVVSGDGVSFAPAAAAAAAAVDPDHAAFISQQQ